MRTDPESLRHATSEADRAARDRHREPDGWERDAREEERREADAHEAAPNRIGPFVIDEVRKQDDACTVTLVGGLEAVRSAGARLFSEVWLVRDPGEERARIMLALSRLEQETAALWLAASPVTAAVAAYTKAVRGVVEGGK